MTKSTHDEERPGQNDGGNDKPEGGGGSMHGSPEETGGAHQPTNPVKEARERVRLQAQEENWRKGDGKPSQRDA